MSKVQKIITEPNSPDQTTENLHLIYTDSGQAKIEIFSRIAESYSREKQETLFKDGLKVNFYKNGKVKSVLTSLFGKINKETGDITVRDSVKLVNLEQNKTLETEVLYWNKSGDSIYTDKPVVITTPKMILYGVGAWTTPEFDTAQLFHPTAKIFIDNN